MSYRRQLLPRPGGAEAGRDRQSTTSQFDFDLERYEAAMCTPTDELDTDLSFEALARQCGLDTEQLGIGDGLDQMDTGGRLKVGEQQAPTVGPVSSWRFNIRAPPPVGGHYRDDNLATGQQAVPVADSSSSRSSAALAPRDEDAASRRSEASASGRHRAPANTPVVSGVQLRPVSCLPDAMRALFPFPLFNKMQSICFPAIVESDQNIVVSAPTGAGKTVLFELAVVRMLLEGPDDAKAVYLAPTKALCSEKTQDWTQRFQSLGCGVVELTGDTLAGLGAAKKCRLIVSTPEKWDSLTRRWHDHSRILSTCRLMMLDEIHILNEPGRGARVEVIVSRTKTHNPSMRFVAVSATIPNLEDVGEWIGSRSSASTDVVGAATRKGSGQSAQIFRFGEEYRPCPLEKFVYSYPQGRDEFSFQSSLNHKLFDIIVRHSKSRPVQIFVSTRKATSQASEVLAERYNKTIKDGGVLPWPRPSSNARRGSAGRGFTDPALDRLASLGLAFHHAGLSLDDRKEVERRFLAEEVRVLCSTSTLATGVNLPAYCVIVRGTKQYSGSQWVELSDLDVIQMIGRAGRPQFDRDGVAVIMCEQQQQQRFEELVGGGRDIESTLEGELIEHINAEIGLGSSRDVTEVEDWLRSTFYAVRLRRKSASSAEVDALISRVCLEAVSSLDEHHLVHRHGQNALGVASTEAGAIMSRYFLPYATMLRLLQIEARPTLPKLLEALSHAEEFRDLRIRQGEKSFLQALRGLPEMRFPPKAVGGVADKVSILVQATLAGINIQAHLQSAAAGVTAATLNPFAEIGTVFRHAPRICKAMLDLALDREDGAMAKAAFELLRSLSGKAWDGSPAVLRQLEGIGEKSIKALAAGKLGTLAQVAEAAPHEIELLLNRNPPFGTKVVKSARSLPRFELTVEQVHSAGNNLGSSIADTSDAAVSVTIDITVGLRDFPEVAKRSRFSGLPIYVCVLTLSSDLDLFNFSRLPISKLGEPQGFTVSCPIARRDQKVIVLAGSDEIAGSCVRAELRPDVRDGAFPAPRLPGFGMPAAEEQQDHDELLGDLDEDMYMAPDAYGEGNELSDDGVVIPHLPSRRRVSTTAAELDLDKMPERLENGNYRCRHTCKGQCRHLCCREGMPRPPKRANSTTTRPSQGPSAAGRAPPVAPTRAAQNQSKGRFATQKDTGACGLLEKIDRLNRMDQQQQSPGPPSPPLKRKRRPVSSSSSDSDRPLRRTLSSSSDDDIDDLPLVLQTIARRRAAREAVQPLSVPAAREPTPPRRRSPPYDAAAERRASTPSVVCLDDEEVVPQPPREQTVFRPALHGGDDEIVQQGVDGEAKLDRVDSPPRLESFATPAPSRSETPAKPAQPAPPSPLTGSAQIRSTASREFGEKTDSLSGPSAKRLPSLYRRPTGTNVGSAASAPLPRGFLGRIGMPPWSRSTEPSALASTQPDFLRSQRNQEDIDAAFAKAKAALADFATSQPSSGGDKREENGSRMTMDEGEDSQEAFEGGEWATWINDDA